jgi:integrase
MAEPAQYDSGGELVAAAGRSVVRAPGALDGAVVQRQQQAGTGGLDLARYLASHPQSRAADAAYLGKLAADVAAYARAAHAEATLDKYTVGWQDFTAFCSNYGLPVGLPERAVDVEVVALYLADLAHRSVAMSTLDGRIAAIRHYHLDHGYRSPTDHPQIRRVRRGIRRAHGVRQEGKDALTLPLLVDMLAAIAPGPELHAAARPSAQRARLVRVRDRCLLLLGFFLGLRREELAALRVDELELLDQGLRVTVGRAKTDQEGAGRDIDLPYAPEHLAWLCPVRATLAWLEASQRRSHLHRTGKLRATACPPLLSGITSSTRVSTSPLTPQQIARAVKNAAAAAGQPAGRGRRGPGRPLAARRDRHHSRGRRSAP